MVVLLKVKILIDVWHFVIIIFFIIVILVLAPSRGIFFELSQEEVRFSVVSWERHDFKKVGPRREITIVEALLLEELHGIRDTLAGLFGFNRSKFLLRPTVPPPMLLLVFPAAPTRCRLLPHGGC